MTQTEKNPQQDMFEANIIPSRLAITAMRDSGYKNTAYALAELIDNSQQAGATVIEVICLQNREVIQHRERMRISRIAVLDNGKGMDAATLRRALQFGNGEYLNNRSGIGRFGMGLPNASISQAGRIDVWSWTVGPDNAIYSYLDIAEIEAGNMTNVPAPIHRSLPGEFREISDDISTSGTLVVWSNLDSHRLTWKTAKATLENTGRLAGRIYRRFIMGDSIRIRLLALDEDDRIIFDKDAVFDDPLYLTPSPLISPPFNDTPMFEVVREDAHEIEFREEIHIVTVRYSIAKKETVELAGTKHRGDMPYGKDAGRNIGVSVMRAERELMLDKSWSSGHDPRERWWGAEVEFPPALDDIFGVTNNKQAATHFSELATMDWKQFAEEGERRGNVIQYLKDEGDHRGHLLDLAESIKRTLNSIRDTIKAQTSGKRSSHKNRHGKPDDVTSTTNERWKALSKEKPIAGEDRPSTEEDLQEIRDDLKQNKKYADSDAEALVSLIRDAKLRIVFLEADFPDSYQLFNVEIKGNITELTFNRRHPAFDDIFGTINMIDKDVSDLTQGEIIEHLTRAINGTKIIFAAWARYEREAGIEKARGLQRVRFDWGQIAAKFLDPDDDHEL